MPLFWEGQVERVEVCVVFLVEVGGGGGTLAYEEGKKGR